MQKQILIALFAALWCASADAQTQIPAPRGWTTQTKTGGATTFTPPDLRAGEKYSITVYEAVPLGGKSPEAYLRQFAGSVGTKLGNLAAPLAIEMREGKVVSGIGAYVGPNGTQLGVLFIASSFDGANVQVLRTLFSDVELVTRYATRQSEIADSMGRRAASSSKPRENARADLPSDLPDGMTVGGDLVPGVYAGTQSKAGMFGSRSSLGLRVYIYANGEYRICDQNDEDFDLSGPVVGKIKVNRARGTLDIKEYFALSNDNFKPDRTYCFYGRNAEGEPVIFGRSSIGATTSNGFTRLIWQGPPTGRVSKSAEDAPARLAKAKRDAIQTTVAPGRGVPASQIAALVHEFSVSPPMTIVGAADGLGGKFSDLQIGNEITDDTCLLLRDGTIYRGLAAAPDQFDASASRRKEPENWGLWKSENGKLQASFGGKPYEMLSGKRVTPAAPNTRFSGRYKFADSSTQGAVSFTAAGRFARTAPAKSEITLVKASKNSGGLAGTYALDGTALTLRYDSGKVTRAAFFFDDKTRDALWFEGHQMFLDAK